MNNGEERKKKKRKGPPSEVDTDKQPEASRSNQNGSKIDDPEQQHTSLDGLTGPEIHLCKALLEGKVREYVVLKELSAELGNRGRHSPI